MCNATNKLITCLFIAATLCACSGNSDQRKAQELFDQATKYEQDGNYQQSIALIDSIDRLYPTAIDIRRQGMALRSKAMTQHLEQKLAQTDSIIVACHNELQPITNDFAHADVPGANGFYYLKGAYGPNIANSTAIQARISDVDFTYYIVASNNGEKIGINQITLHSPQGSMSSLPIPQGDSRVGDVDTYGTDLASFAPSEVDSLGNWAYSTQAAITSATLSGIKGSREIKLTTQQSSQFARTWRMASLSKKLQAAQRLRDKLERQLIVSRDHAANLATDEL